jgi:hypothetical protein
VENTCALLNLEITKYSIFGSLTTDILLLVIMLVGLFNQDLVTGNTFGLGRTLWKQVGGDGSRCGATAQIN